MNSKPTIDGGDLTDEIHPLPSCFVPYSHAPGCMCKWYAMGWHPLQTWVPVEIGNNVIDGMNND